MMRRVAAAATGASLGYAAYTFTIIGISGFGPQFFLGS